MIDLLKLYNMDEVTKPVEPLKSKISFSVESLLSTTKQKSENDVIERDALHERLLLNRNSTNLKCEEDIREEINERLSMGRSPDMPAGTLDDSVEDDDDDENITVDDDDDEIESRESLSPNSAHTVIVPQPLHPSMARSFPPGPPQWTFQLPGYNSLMRSSPPQCKYLLLFCFFFFIFLNNL